MEQFHTAAHSQGQLETISILPPLLHQFLGYLQHSGTFLQQRGTPGAPSWGNGIGLQSLVDPQSAL